MKKTVDVNAPTVAQYLVLLARVAKLLAKSHGVKR